MRVVIGTRAFQPENLVDALAHHTAAEIVHASGGFGSEGEWLALLGACRRSSTRNSEAGK